MSRCARVLLDIVAATPRNASQTIDRETTSIDSGDPLFIALTDCLAARRPRGVPRLFIGVYSSNRFGETS